LETNTPSDQTIKDAVFRLLSYRLRSQAELIRRLTEKGFAASQVKQVVQELVNKGYIDDRKFGMAFARDQVRLRNLGPVIVRNKLRGFGLEPELIESTLATVYEEFPETDLIQYWCGKKGIFSVEGKSAKDRQKFFTFLQRKGFSWDSIQLTLKEIAEN